jgi:glycosyltransferase involved in cell wall biosynthesis
MRLGAWGRRAAVAATASRSYRTGGPIHSDAALRGSRRSPRPSTAAIGANRTAVRDDVPERALRTFADEHPDLRFAPVVVVIAALDEEGGLGTVLREVPPTACGLDVDVLVVDDGSTDATSAVARAGGAYVVRLERNCGHGVALRVGYRLAREHGARFIVTLDGDGQWNPTELPGVLEPVVSGEADFVIGSRVLGATEIDDTFRQAGVRVFGALVRVLTGSRVTDTSSGYRAMRAEVTATVRQEQVQYQTSELLIGALAQGYRVVERPIVQRRRMAGHSKKGHNLFYGMRYARVITRTWLRERRAR